MEIFHICNIWNMDNMLYLYINLYSRILQINFILNHNQLKYFIQKRKIFS